MGKQTPYDIMLEVIRKAEESSKIVVQGIEIKQNLRERVFEWHLTGKGVEF